MLEPDQITQDVDDPADTCLVTFASELVWKADGPILGRSEAEENASRSVSRAGPEPIPPRDPAILVTLLSSARPRAGERHADWPDFAAKARVDRPYCSQGCRQYPTRPNASLRSGASRYAKSTIRELAAGQITNLTASSSSYTAIDSDLGNPSNSSGHCDRPASRNAAGARQPRSRPRTHPGDDAGSACRPATRLGDDER